MAEENSDAPLWNHVQKISKGKGGGNWHFKCKYCNDTIVGSYYRVRAHLLQIKGCGVKICNGVDDDTLRVLKKEQEVAENKKLLSTTTLSLPPPTDLSSKKRKMGDSEIAKAYNINTRDQLDCKIARMFYASGLSFNLSRSPYFQDAIIFAATNNLPGYTPPSYNKLRTTHLGREETHIENKLDTIKASWNRTGVSIVSDGWTDVQRRPLINFLAVSKSGPMFLKAIDASGEFKDSEYMSKLFIDVIDEVGPNKVVQLITDNAPVCKAAGMLVEQQYPNIFWTPCVVHTLNLALKNICSPSSTQEHAQVYEQCKWISETDDDARLIRNFIVNHTMALSIFTKFSTLKLLGMAETRFASTIQMLARFRKVKQALEMLVMSKHWKSYRDAATVNKASRIKECIVNDQWWDKVEYILEFTEPIVSMLRECDSDRPTLHLVYEMWDSTIEKVKDVIFRHEGKDLITGTSEFYNVVEMVLMKRWTKNNTPLHCMAHSLNPKYYSDEWLTGGIGRESPHVDQEISTNREKCFKRLFLSDLQRKTIRSEYGRFSSGSGDYGKWEVMSNRYSEDPLVWWATNGSSTPSLQALAAKLLSQPASSSCCERNWSTYSHVMRLLRNQLTSKRAEDLVYVHSNLRLLSRQEKEYKAGPTRHWDTLGESLNLEGASTLEDAEIYLDEVDLEPPLFDDEGDASGTS